MEEGVSVCIEYSLDVTEEHTPEISIKFNNLKVIDNFEIINENRSDGRESRSIKYKVGV